MSAEAARIIKGISGRKSAGGLSVMLGTVKNVSPLTIKFDEIGFDISSGLWVNDMLLDCKREGSISSSGTSLPDAKIDLKGSLIVGDRVAGVPAGGSQFVVMCKVVGS